ncbi:MAG: dihydropteroate synthase [Acidiferrobacterales bacterium]
MVALKCGGRELDLASTAVMGILNITPDSFADGGVFMAPDKAVARAVDMAGQGAAIIDIGGESTRPGAEAVDAQQEMDRVLPVIEAVAAVVDIPVSIDTAKPEVMRAAVAAGAGLINDVCALQLDGALQAASECKVPVCLMHMQGEPRTMQENPQYGDVVVDVTAFLEQRIKAAVDAGIDKASIVIDPGFGFGKLLAHNMALLNNLQEFKALGVTIMAGLSRKSMIGMVLDLPVEQRLHASVALALIAAQNGARIIRVHDVAPTVQALRMWEAVSGGYPRE